MQLEPIRISEEPNCVEVLGMKFADITHELREWYYLCHEQGALILDPGKNSARLGIGQLQEGYYSWMVGRERVGSVREFIDELQWSEPI